MCFSEKYFIHMSSFFLVCIVQITFQFFLFVSYITLFIVCSSFSQNLVQLTAFLSNYVIDLNIFWLCPNTITYLLPLEFEEVMSYRTDVFCPTYLITLETLINLFPCARIFYFRGSPSSSRKQDELISDGFRALSGC